MSGQQTQSLSDAPFETGPIVRSAEAEVEHTLHADQRKAEQEVHQPGAVSLDRAQHGGPTPEHLL